MSEWQEETKMGGENNILLSWSYSRTPRLHPDLPTLPLIFFMMIFFSRFMPRRHPTVYLVSRWWQRGPAARPECSRGPDGVMGDPGWSLRIAILISKKIWFSDLKTLFLSRCPSENFSSFIALFLTSPRDSCQQPRQQNFCSAVSRICQHKC